MKFGFIAKHRGIWPAGWLCEALGVSRGGFYAWLTRPRSQRSRIDEELGAKVRASFVASDRTYGARRVWKDMLAEGLLILVIASGQFAAILHGLLLACLARVERTDAREGIAGLAPVPAGHKLLVSGRRVLALDPLKTLSEQDDGDRRNRQIP